MLCLVLVERIEFFSFVAFSWTGAISFSFRYLSLFTCPFGATGLRGVNQIVSFVASSVGLAQYDLFILSNFFPFHGL